MRLYKLFVVLTVMLLSATLPAHAGGPRRAWSNSENAFLLKTNDGLEQYTVDGTITFKAAAEGSTIPTWRDCGVVFSPANAGEIITITVNSIDLDGTTNYLLLYDGAIEKIGYGTGGNQGQSNYLPDGFVKWYNSTSAGETYTSTSADGKLSFGFHSKGANGQTGFNITVTSMSPKDMEYVSTGAIAELPHATRGATDVPLFQCNVVTDGGGNPLTLNNLTIDCSALKGNNQVSDVRLYRGGTASGDLLATAATVGSDLIASGLTLKGGNNVFTVVGRLNPDATGTLSALAIKSVTVDGTARSAAPATGGALTIDNVILMPATATTFTIGDDVAFYDDGGKDGKIGSNFTGTVTFVPATAGNAIKVDFSKLAIFNTSTVGKNDILKFYNGREANEDNLITTLLTEAETVKSTAADGSMTVTLASTTGIPADGWEAIVSQFLPGDMTFKGVTVAADQGAGETVAAGERGARLLIVDVLTDNQSNPLSVTGMTLNAATPGAIDGYTIYYLGSKNVFSTATTFATGEVSGNTVTATGNTTLGEGHNYFAIVVDVNERLNNNDEVTLGVSNVTVAGTVQAPATQVSATLAVENICRLTAGTHSHNIYGEWTFTDEEGSGGKYDTTTGDHIVTFYPKVDGAVVELDFDSFDVSYSSSSYGVKALFEVYSGSAVNEANLLWRLSDADQASTGPGRVLRSTAADGSLTVRFDPKDASTYYARAGWSAAVRPFINHNMTIEAVTVNQTNGDIVPLGSEGADLIDFAVTTEGTLTTMQLQGVKLNVKGGEVLSAIHVYTTGYETSRDNATLFGSVNNPASGEVTVAGDLALAEGANNFYVTVDVKSDGTPETVIDAAVTALVIDGTATAVSGGDPAGERVAKAMYVMQSGDNTVVVSQPLMFYDDGGADGNFSKGFEGAVTFVPAVAGYGIELNAVEYATGTTSNYFYVYNGREHNGTTDRVGVYSGTTGPVDVISEADDGTLTVYFKSGTYSTPTSGWAIEVKLHEYAPNTLTAVSATAAATDEVVRGSSNAPLVKVALTVEGDNGEVSLNDFAFTVGGSATAARLFYTGTTEAFSTNEQLAATVTGTGNVTFTAAEPLTINSRGTYYLWLAVDVDADAEPGSTVSAIFNSLNAEAAVESTEATRIVKAGFKGDYVIGASDRADYPTFAAAIQAMQVGVEGAVRFEIEDGTYAENITIADIAGTGETHNVTFTSQSGNRNAVVLAGGSPDTSYGATSQVVLVSGTPWVTFENVSIIPASQSFSHGVRAVDGSHHFTLRGSVVKADQATATTGICLVTVQSTGDGKACDDVVIEDNTLQGGRIGVNFTYASVSDSKAQRPVVSGNTVSETGRIGIYVNMTSDALIKGNTITQTSTTQSGYPAIDMTQNDGQFVIEGNTIVNTNSAYSYGIYMRQQNVAQADAPARVFNNSILVNSSSASSYGVYYHSTCANIEFAFNTIRMANLGRCFYGFNSSGQFTGLKLTSNLLQGLGESGEVLFIYGNRYDNVTATGNVLYHTSGSLTNATSDIDTFNTTVHGVNTVEQASFAGDTDNHLAAEGGMRCGAPVSYVTVDHDGLARDAEAPTVGAYEYRELTAEKPEILVATPVALSGEATATTASFVTRWSQAGQLYSIVEPVAQGAPRHKAPAAVDIKSGTPQAVIAGSDVTTTFDELAPETAYKAYFLMVSEQGQESDIVESETFTTAAAEVETLAIEIDAPVTIEAGGSATLTGIWAGGTEPYTVTWTDQMGNTIGTAAGEEYQITVSPSISTGYVLTVESADGQTAHARTGVKVRGASGEATFDDNLSPAEGYDQGFSDMEQWYSGSYGLQVGSYWTPVMVDDVDYGYWTWYGYALASTTDSQWRGFSYLYPDQFNSVMGGAHDGSDNFVIACPVPYGSNPCEIEVTSSEQGQTVSGFYITNTAYAVSAMLTGNKFSTKANKGDWFKVTAIGHHADGTTTTKDFYLADYRADKEVDRYIIDKWEWFDLRDLGEVTSLTFAFDGSDVDPEWGLNTPMYFAMDNLGGQRDELPAGIAVGVGRSKYDAASYFTLDGDGSTVTISLEEPVSSDELDVSYNATTGKIEVNGKVDGASRDVVLIATQKGHTQYVRLRVTVDSVTGITNVFDDDTDADNTLYDLQGRRVVNPGPGIYVRAGKKVVM